MGLTQSDLAGAELSKSFVSLLETARSYPSVETLLLLAKRAGASPGSLLLESADLQLDAALSLLTLASNSVWRRPAWARGLLDTVKELLPDMPLRIRAETAFLRGLTFAADGHLKEAEQQAEVSRRAAEQARFGPSIARASALSGHLLMLRRDFRKAMAQFGDAVGKFRASGSLRSEFGIRTLLWLGSTSIQTGRVRYARGVYEQARRLAARLGLRTLEGRALWGLGHHAWVEGDLTKAARLLLEAKSVFEESEDLAELGEVMRNLGRLLREQGKVDAARDALDHAVRVANQVGNLRMRSAAYEEMARVWVQRGDLERAEEAVGHAGRLARSAGDRLHRGRVLTIEGVIAARRGDRPKARRLLGQAVRVLGRVGAKDEAAEVSRDLALLRGPATSSEADHYVAQALGSTAPRSMRKRAPRRPTRSRRPRK